jgi:uncharacterized RDD family membrane protein YckC
MTADGHSTAKMGTMSGVVEPVVGGAPVQPAPAEERRFVGVVTRATSWVLDAIAINVVAIVAGLGAELIFSIFPVSPDFAAILKPIAGILYIAWSAIYFVGFWSWTGQTLGARLMQIRLLTRNGGRVKPAHALVRFIGMNLAMIPLFAGFYPILFGRRGFPDWLAHTEVVEALQLSIAQARMATLRATGNGRRRSPATAHRDEVSTPVPDGDQGSPQPTPRDRSPGEARG